MHLRPLRQGKTPFGLIALFHKVLKTTVIQHVKEM